MREWSANITSELYKKRIIEAAFWCGKRPGNTVKMNVPNERVERPKIRGIKPTTLVYDEVAMPTNAYLEARKLMFSMTPEQYKQEYLGIWVLEDDGQQWLS